MNKQLTNRDFFFCYSPKLASYITQNGINYITVANHTKTGDTFSLFQKSDRLQKIIEEYRSNRQ